MELRHIANAGFCLSFGKTNLLVDALHRGNTDGYQQVDEVLLEIMKTELPEPEMLLFSHCHPDHFSRELVEEVRGVWKNSLVALPEKFGYEQPVLDGERGRIGLESGSLEYFRLPHEGEQYRGVSHYGFLVRGDGLRVFAAGDCALNAEELWHISEIRNVDVAVLNFPWVSLQAGRRFIDEVLRPKKLLINHLPVKEADKFGYQDAAKKAAGKYYSRANIRFLTEKMQRIIL